MSNNYHAGSNGTGFHGFSGTSGSSRTYHPTSDLPEAKFCIDCEYCKHETWCSHFSNLSLINKSPVFTCLEMRSGPNYCGSLGILFKQKETKQLEVEPIKEIEHPVKIGWIQKIKYYLK